MNRFTGFSDSSLSDKKMNMNESKLNTAKNAFMGGFSEEIYNKDKGLDNKVFGMGKLYQNDDQTYLFSLNTSTLVKDSSGDKDVCVEKKGEEEIDTEQNSEKTTKMEFFGGDKEKETGLNKEMESLSYFDKKTNCTAFQTHAEETVRNTLQSSMVPQLFGDSKAEPLQIQKEADNTAYFTNQSSNHHTTVFIENQVQQTSSTNRIYQNILKDTKNDSLLSINSEYDNFDEKLNTILNSSNFIGEYRFNQPIRQEPIRKTNNPIPESEEQEFDRLSSVLKEKVREVKKRQFYKANHLPLLIEPTLMKRPFNKAIMPKKRLVVKLSFLNCRIDLPTDFELSQTKPKLISTIKEALLAVYHFELGKCSIHISFNKLLISHHHFIIKKTDKIEFHIETEFFVNGKLTRRRVNTKKTVSERRVSPSLQ